MLYECAYCNVFNVQGYLFLGLSIVCRGNCTFKKNSAKLFFVGYHAPDPSLVSLSIHELHVLSPGLVACLYPSMKLYIRERNVLETLHVRVIMTGLTCYVFSVTKTVVNRTKAAEHSSCPQPHHWHRVSRDKKTKTVPSSANVHFNRPDVAPLRTAASGRPRVQRL